LTPATVGIHPPAASCRQPHLLTGSSRDCRALGSTPALSLQVGGNDEGCKGRQQVARLAGKDPRAYACARGGPQLPWACRSRNRPGDGPAPRSLHPIEQPMTTFRTSREIPATVEQVFAALSPSGTPRPLVGTRRLHQQLRPLRIQAGWPLVAHHARPMARTTRTKTCSRKSNRLEGRRRPRLGAEIPPDHHPGTLRTRSAGDSVAGLRKSRVASRIEHIVVPANEQNLERLAAEVTRAGDWK